MHCTENRLYSTAAGDIVDAAMELIAPLQDGSPGPAVTRSWAALESLLSDQGDEDVIAADRMASIVACSFVRAELTALSYVLEAVDTTLATLLNACASTRDRAQLTVNRILSDRDHGFGSPSDDAAIKRMRQILDAPQTNLKDIEAHLTTALRRLYRQRNLIIHWGKTDSVALNATLRTVAPLVGAGLDRIVHGWLVESLRPVPLAARARVGIDTVGSAGAKAPVDLLA